MVKISASSLLRFILWSCLAVLPLAHSAGATTYNIHAIPLVPTNLSDFTITFEDDGNKLLDFEEIISFSGFTNYNFPIFDENSQQMVEIDLVFTEVVKIPGLEPTLGPPLENIGITTPYPYTNGSLAEVDRPVMWLFRDTFGVDYEYHREGFWTYTLTQVTPVPLPPAVVMFGTGLILLGWARRKKSRGN